MLDAPVSGGDVGAKAGTLSIMVGGTPEDFEAARPVFEAMGKTLTLCGPAGAGQLVKACNQIVGALVLNAISEALIFGRAAGVDPEIMIRVLQGGVAATRAMDVRGARMAKGDFAPGFKAAHHLKDLRIVIDEAKARGLTLPTTGRVADMFATLVSEGHGTLDNSSILTMVERAAGAAPRRTVVTAPARGRSLLAAVVGVAAGCTAGRPTTARPDGCCRADRPGPARRRRRRCCRPGGDFTLDRPRAASRLRSPMPAARRSCCSSATRRARTSVRARWGW